MIQLIEIFCSVQGESSYVGYPCIFIRLAECNLRCNYCDTKYSYIADYSLSVEAIIEEVKRYHPIKLVEITGGEPLLQKEVYSLITQLERENFKVLLETNGSLPLDAVSKTVHKIVDVKCPDSGSKDSFCPSNLHTLNETDELKFVISSYDDYLWSKNYVIENNLLNSNVLFSAVFEKVEPKVLVDWIIQDRLNVRFQLQIHKYIWNPNKKGV